MIVCAHACVRGCDIVCVCVCVCVCVRVCVRARARLHIHTSEFKCPIYSLSGSSTFNRHSSLTI